MASIVLVKIVNHGGRRAAAVHYVPHDVPTAKAQKRH